jgi:DUF438 domain-containing protein
MRRMKTNSKVKALTGLVKRIGEEDDLRGLCHEAGELAETVKQTDILTTEQLLVRHGYSSQMARQLLTLFVFMGMYDENTVRRQGTLGDDHILQRINVEHDLFRCYAAELKALSMTIMQVEHMSDVSAEFRTLIRVSRYLNLLWEHMDREEDIIFPYLRRQGYGSLCLSAEKDHVRLRGCIDNLMGLILSNSGTSLAEFKMRLTAIAHLFCPLLLDHLAFEEGLIHPISLVVIDNPDTWTSIKALCDQMGYCELSA